MIKKNLSAFLLFALVLFLALAFDTKGIAAGPGAALSAPDYLCFTGTGAFTVSMEAVEAQPGTLSDVNLEYCTGDFNTPANWKAFTVGETEVKSTDGSPVYFRGTGNARFSKADANWLEDYYHFCLTADEEGATVAASGNIMTLLEHDPVPEALGEGNTNAFAGLFLGCSILTDAPDLPSLVTVHACYMSMFQDCPLLTNVPDLPAENLADYCYYQLFMRCTALKNAPQLSDKISTAGQCSCENMFFYCIALENAPEKLSATTLKFASYRCMFWWCTSLEKAPGMSIEEVADDSCCSMFNNCTMLEDVSELELKVTSPGWRSFGSMFYNCRSLGAVPFLAPTALVNESCRSMFYNCKRMLIKEGSAEDYDWRIPASTAAYPVESLGYGTAYGSVTVEVPKSGYNYYKVDILPWSCFIDKNKNGTRETGESQYLSFDDAANDAEDGVEENILLLCDSKASAMVSNSKIIVLDLNDHVLSCDDPSSPVILVYGNLTVKGAGTTTGSTIHKWVPNGDSTDSVPDGLWVMNDAATGTEGSDYFVTKGGVITGSYDSGIRVAAASASLKLVNTNIVGNAGERERGGGINHLSNSPLQITGGRVSGNVSADSVGGVYLLAYDDTASSEIILSGNAVVDENKGFLANNLALERGKGSISLQNPAAGMKVGVSLIENKFCVSGVFAKNGSKDETRYFFSDLDCYRVMEESGKLVLSSRINQQPSQSNKNTVGIDMTGLSRKNLSYQWSTPTKNVSCTADMFEKEIGETGITAFEYNAAKDTYSSVVISGGYLALQPTADYAGKIEQVSFKVDTKIDYLLDCSNLFSPTPIEPDEYGYYSYSISDISLLEITGCLLMACNGNYVPQDLTISNLKYSGMSLVKGQTQASLTVTQAGTYQCRVTFEDGSTVDSELFNFVPHTHDWTYEASGATITAVCQGSGTCDAADTTLTLAAPKLTTYGENNSAAATLSAETLAGQSALPAIHYARKTGGGTYEELQAAPTAAGDYKAFITVKSAGVDVTAYVEYCIARKTIHVKANNQTSVAGENLKALTYTADKLLGTDSLTGALATNANKNIAGKYDILQGTLTGGDNYSIVFTNGSYEVTADNSGTASANTGDSDNPAMYVLLMIAALGMSLSAVAGYRKKKA